jgi:hypothetical protein
MGATILHPAVFRFLGTHRAFGTIANHPYPMSSHAESMQVIFHRRRPPLAEREVIIARAARVGVPFDGDIELRLAS